jgi:hypothetical protein
MVGGGMFISAKINETAADWVASSEAIHGVFGTKRSQYE